MTMKDNMTCPTCGTFCKTVIDPDGNERYVPVFSQKEIDWAISDGERLAGEVDKLREELRQLNIKHDAVKRNNQRLLDLVNSDKCYEDRP